MHRNDQKEILLKTIADGYTITAACKRAGVSRMFYDRHYKSDLKFRKKADKAHILGKQVNDDRVVSVHMKLVNEGKDWRPIKYYLDHHVAPYMKKETSSTLRSYAIGMTGLLSSGVDSYTQFIRWSAMPFEERVWCGIETREQFCKTFQVANVGMLGIWSKRRDFEPRVIALREEWVFSKTSEILGGVYEAARNGDYRSQKLWLEHVYHITEKREANNPNQTTITPDDIRALIDALPEETRERNYTRLREILDDASIAAQAGLLEEGETKATEERADSTKEVTQISDL